MSHVGQLPGREHELARRRTMELSREEAGDGAPPASRGRVAAAGYPRAGGEGFGPLGG
ncbi:DUF6191 domain-containing protein [Streptomyces sp. DSM 44915]|uniref:DUF6191 domain-containing protein n=1 Tax=Streptomyces chisholmiae TaxID=3075540 RepID=A0ABU2JYK3_9ACTN|nr:DUF6191 domain-containing protein [Streptomyces sp. DSM 44915]MDT0269814.1 DUF6191 domain-containing protein [Streptomyces sp. DSM 44915]